MRNKSLALLGVIAIALSGCQGGAASATPGGTTGATPGATPGGTTGEAPTKLTIAALQGDESLGLKAIAPDCGTQTGTTVEIVENPYGPLYDKLVTTFQANDATFDLVMIDDPWMPKFGTDGSFQDLGQYGIERDPDISSIVWDVGTWPPPHGAVPPSEVGKPAQLLGVTVVGNVEMFMNRSDIVPAPKTYDDVLANAKAQNKADFAGYIIRGKATNPVVADFLPILWSFGGDVFDDNWNVILDNDKSKAAIKFLVDDLKAVAQADPANTDAADRSQLFATEKGLQSSVWPGEIAGIVNNAEVSKVIGKAEYLPIPAGPSGKGIGMMGNWMLAIPAASQNGAKAAEFIKCALTAESQKVMAANKGIPSRTSVLNDAELGAANPYFPVLAQALQVPPNWRPRTDQWNAVESIIGTHLNGALAGLETADDAATKASEEIRTLMKGAGYPTQ
jgi:multiple sugar transport system substrate-binding protein